MKYPSFRLDCTKGYYNWEENEYNIWKMRVKQFNGATLGTPFLYELAKGQEPQQSVFR